MSYAGVAPGTTRRAVVYGGATAAAGGAYAVIQVAQLPMDRSKQVADRSAVLDRAILAVKLPRPGPAGDIHPGR